MTNNLDSIQIRDLRDHEIQSCAELIDSLPLYQSYGFRTELAQNALTSAHQRGDCLVTAVSATSGGVAGIAWFVQNGAFQRSGYLRLLAVSPKFQGAGIGRLIMKELERRFLQPSGIFMLANSENSGAIRFYESMGYKNIGFIPDFVKPGLNEVILFKGAQST